MYVWNDPDMEAVLKITHAQQGVVYLLFVSIKIGKSQHLSECMVNKWDKMVSVRQQKKTPPVSFLTL